jgi:hypothetical protein
MVALAVVVMDTGLRVQGMMAALAQLKVITAALV